MRDYKNSKVVERPATLRVVLEGLIFLGVLAALGAILLVGSTK